MQAALVFFKPDGDRRDFPLTRRVTLLGRRKNCHLRIPLKSVSRQHAQIEQHGDELLVRDLGSSNGTKRNGKRVIEARLRPGDRLTLGAVTFIVTIGGKPEHIEPVPGVASGHEAAQPQDVDASASGKPVSLGAATESMEDEDDPIAALEAMSSQPSWPSGLDDASEAPEEAEADDSSDSSDRSAAGDEPRVTR